MAALVHLEAIAGDVSCCARRRRPLVTIVAAEESAGRGGGVRGALKSLFIQATKQSMHVGRRKKGGITREQYR